MQFEFTGNPISNISSDVVAVFAFQSEKDKKEKYTPLEDFKKIDKDLNKKISKALEVSGFSGKRGEFLDYFPEGKILSKWIVVIGLGKKSEFDPNDLRRVLGKSVSHLKGKVDSLALSIPSKELRLEPDFAAQLIAEGLLLGYYQFNKYKTEKDKKRELSSVIFSNKGDAKKEKVGVEKAKVATDATIMARDLVNEQSAVATPTFLADLALSIAKKDPKHITCKVFSRDEAKKMGMDAFLGIARAAQTPPKFIFLQYRPDKIKKKEKLALVGKGITFDSGGINVKTGDHMSDMKMDMSGAAVVLSVFSVITRIKPDYPVIGLIAATANMISGNSLVPGDVVKAMNGKTIEILNTDAEGRVTLADSLSFAVKEGATKIIDLATLTGAVLVALGTDISALFSNDRKLAEQIKESAKRAGEKVWEMPLEKDYREMNKSEVADVANIPSSRYGGTITAALFLQEFIGKKKWAHLDIAGPAFSSKASDIGPKGGTGHGVRTILNLLSL
ncbi:MAG: leucyl aminopeptidase [Candidatus Levybacteria bacterium]|nr:leucyl aminopeptidase [Candidatus Levybacteria bacterium]